MDKPWRASARGITPMEFADREVAQRWLDASGMPSTARMEVRHLITDERWERSLGKWWLTRLA